MISVVVEGELPEAPLRLPRDQLVSRLEVFRGDGSASSPVA